VREKQKLGGPEGLVETSGRQITNKGSKKKKGGEKDREKRSDRMGAGKKKKPVRRRY